MSNANPKNTSAKDPIMKVQEDFIAEIQAKGIEHALTWGSAWYTQCARAIVTKQMDGCPKKFWVDSLSREASSRAMSANNFGTSPSANLLRANMISAYAEALSHLQRKIEANPQAWAAEVEEDEKRRNAMARDGAQNANLAPDGGLRGATIGGHVNGDGENDQDPGCAPGM